VVVNMDEEVVRKYIKAGDIAWRVKKSVINAIRPGIKLLKLANDIENLIRDLGGEPAFPINVSINSVAAHKTPLLDDTNLIINEGDVIKVDIGVHVEGYIADTALTLCFNDRYLGLVEACSEALEKALSMVGAGVKFSHIGKVIDETARKYSFRTIRNLGGHSLDRYEIHSGEVIPNYADPLSFGKFKKGGVYAIEPFLSNGKGYVVESKEVDIYALSRGKYKGLTNQELSLISYVSNRFKTLPFCERWLEELGLDLIKLRTTLKELAVKNVLRQYPVLNEALSTSIVVQFEETVIIADGVIVITNPNIKT